jgi:ArsR family transcriptional regulator
MMGPVPLRGQVIEDVARLFTVLGHPTRVQILRLLHRGERDVSGLRADLGVSAANVSQHLHALRAQHLVEARREGTHLHYSLRDERIAGLINFALDLLAGDASRAGELRRAIERVRLRR